MALCAAGPARATPFIEFTFDSTVGGSVMIEGTSFFTSFDDSVSTSTLVSGFATPLEGLTFDTTGVDYVAHTSTPESLRIQYGDAGGAVPIASFRIGGNLLATSLPLYGEGMYERLEGGGFNVGNIVFRGLLTVDGNTPAGQAFVDELSVLTGGSLTLSYLTRAGPASSCVPIGPGTFSCSGYVSTMVPHLVSEALSGGGTQFARLLGGETAAGGVNVTLDVAAAGAVSAVYEPLTTEEIQERVLNGDFADLEFRIPGDEIQLWELDFGGNFSGLATLVFTYDDALLSGVISEDRLAMWHFTGGQWVQLAGVLDVVLNTITVQVADFSPFALGFAAPEPGTAPLAAAGALAVLLRLRTQRRRRSG
jgi:hypothetical protein